MGLPIDYNMLSGRRYTSYHPVLFAHGSREQSAAHHREMEDVANDICRQYFTYELSQILDKMLESKLNEIYKASYNSFITNLTFDVETAVNVAFQNAETIFRDKRTQQVVATHVMNEIKRQMSGKNYKLKL